MNAKELFKLCPCRMTAYDLNETKGKYKKLQFLPGCGDLSNNCYIRYTKSGFVIYKKNGYIQPVFVYYFGKAKVCIKRYEDYVKHVLKAIEL